MYWFQANLFKINSIIIIIIMYGGGILNSDRNGIQSNTPQFLFFVWKYSIVKTFTVQMLCNYLIFAKGKILASKILNNLLYFTTHSKFKGKLKFLCLQKLTDLCGIWNGCKAPYILLRRNIDASTEKRK